MTEVNEVENPTVLNMVNVIDVLETTGATVLKTIIAYTLKV